MSCSLRCFAILAALALLALLLTPTLQAAGIGTSGAAARSARPQSGTPETMLLEAANRERTLAGLAPFHWDTSLAASARKHAELMAQKRTLSHQFPGEAALQDRATQTGARFSVIAENVAEGPTVLGLHTQWMNSPPHRANILADDMNAIGIAIVQSGNMLFAVQDFAEAIPTLNLDAQEMQIATMLSARGLRMVKETSDARKTCDMDRGFVGNRPLTVLRYETTDLSRFPEDIDEKVQSGKFHSAAIGACDAGGSVGFARFRIAILLFP
jgi:uncharacterized protein YkwD